MNSECQKFSKRLNEVLTDAGFPEPDEDRTAAVANLLKVPSEQVAKWLAGESYPKTNKLVKLAKYVRVRSNWLLSGIGGKQLDANEEEAYISQIKSQLDDELPEEQKRRPMANDKDAKILTKEALELAQAYMRLPYSQQLPIHTLVMELARNA